MAAAAMLSKSRNWGQGQDRDDGCRSDDCAEFHEISWAVTIWWFPGLAATSFLRNLPASHALFISAYLSIRSLSSCTPKETPTGQAVEQPSRFSA
jgi:hypothetical protein